MRLKKRVHASTLKMRLMHGVEKQELMHHFLESAGRAESRPAGRAAHLRPAPGSTAIAKPVNQKNRDCPRAVPVLSAFVILIRNPAAVQDSFSS